MENLWRHAVGHCIFHCNALIIYCNNGDLQQKLEINSSGDGFAFAQWELDETM